MNSIFDDALERLRGTSTEIAGGGDPNHGPMAAEALIALRREEVAVAWVDRYRRRLGRLPPSTSPINAGEWKAALGRVDRTADWAEFFRRQIDLATWSTVLDMWLPRLLPAAISAGMHGLIRTAHIARALGEGVTPPRLDELAMALGYWAAFYRELPGHARLLGTLPPEVALERVPRVVHAQLADGMPREVIFVVGEYREFLTAVETAREPSSIDAALSSLTEMSARIYLANAGRNPLVLLHAVTGPAALRLLLPHMSAATQRDAFAAVYHCAAALVAAYASDGALVPTDATAQVPPAADIVDFCIETDDPHAIKFVEACVRENQLNPQPIYLAAALDWATRLHAAKNWTAQQRGAAGIGF
jgi:hypothetical protein